MSETYTKDFNRIYEKIDKPRFRSHKEAAWFMYNQVLINEQTKTMEKLGRFMDRHLEITEKLLKLGSSNNVSDEKE